MSQLSLFGEERRKGPAPARRPSPPRGPLVLRVHHYSERKREGEEKMVGKIIPHLTGELVFYHAHDGSQWHKKHACPSPMDRCLVDFLEGQEIRKVYVYDRKLCTLFVTTLDEIRHSPIEFYGNRTRYYPNIACWWTYEKVEEVREKRDRFLIDEQGTILLRAPFLTRQWTIQVRAV